MKYFFKSICLFCLPFVVILVPYFIFDPFKVIWEYKSYYPLDGSPLYIDNNRSFVSAKMFLKNKDIYHYDSFVFGSSCSTYFLVEDWKQYLPDCASCFHFDGYDESLAMILSKMNFVSQNAPLTNVLICLEPDMLSKDQLESGHLWMIPPQLCGYSNLLDFQLTNVETYFNYDFLGACWKFWFMDSISQEMIDKQLMNILPTYYDIQHNETRKRIEDSKYPDSLYTSTKLRRFYHSRQTQEISCPQLIGESQYNLLLQMKNILEAKSSSYRIVINPQYDQQSINPKDVKILRDLFGKHFYDFSGVNLFTSDYHDYSDPYHFSDRVAAKMMQIIYESDSARQQQMMDSIYMRN